MTRSEPECSATIPPPLRRRYVITTCWSLLGCRLLRAGNNGVTGRTRLRFNGVSLPTLGIPVELGPCRESRGSTLRREFGTSISVTSVRVAGSKASPIRAYRSTGCEPPVPGRTRYYRRSPSCPPMLRCLRPELEVQLSSQTGRSTREFNSPDRMERSATDGDERTAELTRVKLSRS